VIGADGWSGSGFASGAFVLPAEQLGFAADHFPFRVTTNLVLYRLDDVGTFPPNHTSCLRGPTASDMAISGAALF